MEEKEKKFNFSIIPILAIFVLLIIIIIWTPTFKKMSKDGINTYETVNYDSQISSFYSNYLKENLKVTNFSNLYTKIDEEYLESLNLNDEESAKEYLKSNNLISMNISMGYTSVYRGAKNNVIIVKYYVNDVEKYAIIKEKTPYHYTISFSTDENYGKGIVPVNKKASSNQIDFNASILESNKDSLRIKVEIVNNSNNIVKYDASYLDSIQLVYDTTKTMNMAATASSNSTAFEIAPGSSRSIEGTFNINFADQLKIEKIRLNNFSINNEEIDMEI